MTEPIAQASAERALENLTRILDRSLGLVVALIMFFMMVLTFVDVVGRQFRLVKGLLGGNQAHRAGGLIVGSDVALSDARSLLNPRIRRGNELLQIFVR